MIKKSKENKIRNSPRQRRSRVIFDSILESSMHLINDIGFVRLTTNKVAEVAGVSIGSLYRYFPNKEVLLFNLIKKYLEDNHNYFIDSLISLEGQGMDEAISHMVDISMCHFLKQPKFFILLHQKMFETEAREIIFEARRSLAIKIVNTIENYFPDWNIETNREVLIEKVCQASHSYTANIFATILEGSCEKKIELVRESMIQLFLYSIKDQT